MNKFLSALLCLGALFFAASANAIDIDGATIDVFGNIFVRGGMDKNDENPDSAIANDNLFTGKIVFGKKFSNEGEASLTIRAGSGDSQIPANDAVQDNSANVVLSGFWYLQPIIMNELYIKAGRIGVSGGDNKLLNDDDTHFIHPLFTGERSNWKPFEGNYADAWGFSIIYEPSDLVELIYGYAGPDGKRDSTTETIYNTYEVERADSTEDLGSVTIPQQYVISGKTYQPDKNGYNSIEANFKFTEKGNYRIKYWHLNEVKGETDAMPSGIAISIDQEVYYGIIAGFRVGQVSDKKALPYSTLNNLAIKESYSFAVQVNGLYWSRMEDSVAIAAGKEVYNTLSNSDGIILELYYRYTINDYIGISPSLQYQQYSDDNKNNQILYALRAHIAF